jgi:hypothetical protein
MKTKYRLRKGFKILIAGLLLLMLAVPSVLACEIEIGAQGGEKTGYRIGDTVILEIKVFLSHRNCPEGIEATKYKLEGLKALGATAWQETSSNTFLRKIKVQITGDGKPAFHVVRTCDKEGGYGVFTFNLLE